MSHPLDHLAPFVDGSLDAPLRAEVDRHLLGCARCRAEVVTASAARDRLRAAPMPTAPDLAARFTPDRLAASAAPSAARPAWSKVAPLLAAAAVVALLAVVVPRLGGSSGDAGTAADGVAESAIEAGPLRLEVEATDYDESALQEGALASAAAIAAGQVEAPPDQGEAGAEASSAAAPDQARLAGPGRSARAVACLERAFPGFPGRLVRLRRATFEGTPAFIGDVLEGPGADTTPDTLSIWVAAIEDCSILTLTSVRI